MGKPGGKKGGKGGKGKTTPPPKAPPTTDNPYLAGKPPGKDQPPAIPMKAVPKAKTNREPIEIDEGWMSDTDLEQIGPIDPVNGTLWTDGRGDLYRVTSSEGSTPIADPNRRQEQHENIVPGEEVYNAPPPPLSYELPEDERTKKPVPPELSF